jgi:hypothetical protein
MKAAVTKREQDDDTVATTDDDAFCQLVKAREKYNMENATPPPPADPFETLNQQPTPTPEFEFILIQLAQLQDTVEANMARQEDFKTKIAKLHDLMEQLIG